MNAPEHDWIGAHRAHEARLITTAFAVLAVVCLLAGLLPGVEHAIISVLIAAAVLAVLGIGVWLVARWVRERREEPGRDHRRALARHERPAPAHRHRPRPPAGHDRSGSGGGGVMWDATVWAVVTWLKFTALFAVLVGGCWLWFGVGSGQFALAVIAAALAEIHLIRLLAREWTHEASMHWWWSA